MLIPDMLHVKKVDFVEIIALVINCTAQTESAAESFGTRRHDKEPCRRMLCPQRHLSLCCWEGPIGKYFSQHLLFTKCYARLYEEGTQHPATTKLSVK